MEQEKHPTALVILDGFGYSTNQKNNAIDKAHIPNIRHWMQDYPCAFLNASGSAVGLSDGFMGNSEVGHLTIGAGRIITQPLVLMNDLINSQQLKQNSVLTPHLEQLAKQQKALHLIGLLSDGGVHSHINHLLALLSIAVTYEIKAIYIHAILDGRDTPPHSAAMYLKKLLEYCKPYPQIQLATLCGRYYAMDRDHHWDRTQQYYQILTTKSTDQDQSWESIQKAYHNNQITDEYIPPIQLNPKGIIKAGDGIICFNIRPDRVRQLTACFIDKHFKEFDRPYIPLAFFITPVSYGTHYPTTTLIEMPLVTHTLKEVLTSHDKSVFSIAETEKYAHITYFFDGNREALFPLETRILVPSVTTEHINKYPRMAADEITTQVLQSLRTLPQDFYLINYANADMVGHSGDLKATVKAIECLDEQLGLLYEQIIMRMKGTLYITADHGKAEDLFNPHNHQPHTAHTTNPVPFIAIQKEWKNKEEKLPLNGLADIAPFILKQMGLPIPEIMHQIPD